MEPPINAIVIGAGNFGKHYARILSQLNAEELHQIPVIDKLVVTRTQFKRAQNMAQTVVQDINCSVNEVIPAEANTTQDVIDLLKRYTPRFIGITARDKTLRDTIHAVYATHAVRYGSVLCEKPFSSATGDGSSLKYFDNSDLQNHADRFGLELPMAVVLQQFMQNSDWHDRFINANRIEFHWQAPRFYQKLHIINDLALHPWSLIPQAYQVKSVDVDAGTNRALIRLDLYHADTGKGVSCRMTLKGDGDFRGFRLDDHVLGIFKTENVVQLVELNASLNDAAGNEKAQEDGQLVLEVDNPLKQNIIATLMHSPTVNLVRTYESQLFLEILHGYVPPTAP